MKRLLTGAALGCLVVSAAYAQEPAPKPEPNAAQPPANQTQPATPDIKAPKQTAPTETMGAAVPPAKSADTGTKAPTFIPDASWEGRYLYSSDDKDLGKIVSVKRIGAFSDIYFDMGGFLGLGATRRHVASEQVQDVQNDRIVLRLSKAQAETLPAEK